MPVWYNVAISGHSWDFIHVFRLLLPGGERLTSVSKGVKVPLD